MLATNKRSQRKVNNNGSLADAGQPALQCTTHAKRFLTHHKNVGTFLSFEPDDLARMHELAEKNRQGTLDAKQREALRAYRQMGLQFDLLKSKARLALKSHANGS